MSFPVAACQPELLQQPLSVLCFHFLSFSPVIVAAPVDEGTGKVVEEAETDEAAEDGERALPEASVEAAVASVDPVDDAIAAAGEEYGRICVCEG